MPTTYPGAIDDYDVVPESQTAITAHRERHQDIEDAMEAVQTFVGISAATDATSVAGRLKQVQSDVLGLGLDLDGTAPGGAVKQLRTGQHFTQNGARIHRFNDRMFLAAATQNDGAFPNVNRCWMDDLWVGGGFGTGPGASSIFYLANDTNPNNAIGVLSAVQTKDFTSAGTTGIGGFSCVFNNHATLATKVYGHYIEAHRTTAATADTYGLEIDTRTLKMTLQPTPRQLGDVSALQLASGAEWSASGQFDASCAIQLAPNPMKFKVGINIMHDALVDIGGGITEAMNMNRYSLVSWFDAAGARSGYITSSATAVATGTAIDMADNQVKFNAAGGALNFAFVTSATAANYLSFYSATTGNAVRVLAGGTDPNINVSVEPKGAGQVVIPIANVRNAANDAAAAALVPPVPIGGIYRNGSVLQIRVT